MREPKRLGPFSGTHLTVMICTAILAPTALYAVTYTPVVISDPGTGREAYVDIGRRLFIYDPIAGYANNPANLVKISGTFAGSVGAQTLYTVPTGKTLIVRSANLNYYFGANNSDNYFYLKESGKFGTVGSLGAVESPNAVGSQSLNLGPGYYIHAGNTLIGIASDNVDNNIVASYSVEGYLVPDAAVPPAGSPEAAQQAVYSGAPSLR